jgi:hypothetical protein
MKRQHLMVSLIAGSLLVAWLSFLAPSARAGGKHHPHPKPEPPLRVEVLSLPPIDAPVGGAAQLDLNTLGTPITAILDRAEGLPANATDSETFEIPEGHYLILDYVGVRANLDRFPPEDLRLALFMSADRFSAPIGFAEVIGHEVFATVPMSIVVEGHLKFALLGSLASALPTSVRYSIGGRLVPAPAAE